MALQKTITKNIYGQNITFENTYSKIGRIEGTKDKLSFSLLTFNNEKIDLIEANNFSFIPSVADDASNFIKQGYEYLKTLDEYEDSVDC